MKTTFKKVVTTASIFLVSLTFGSCQFQINPGVDGSGTILTESRPGEQNFSSIDVNYGIEVVLTQGPQRSITVQADDNLLQLIETRIEGEVLYITATEDYESTKTPKVTITIPEVKGLSASAGAKITTRGSIISPKLTVESNSGSEVSISVEGEIVSLETSSGSSIEARGKALTLETSSSSGSSIDAAHLRANDIVAQSSSGSNTKVHPLVTLDATASSGSSIDYANKPKTLKKNESSGGSVSQN